MRVFIKIVGEIKKGIASTKETVAFPCSHKSSMCLILYFGQLSSRNPNPTLLNKTCCLSCVVW